MRLTLRCNRASKASRPMPGARRCKAGSGCGSAPWPSSSSSSTAAWCRSTSARAPMPGVVVALHVAAGDAVGEGDALMVIESMKLETTLVAPREARIQAVHFGVGATFGLKAILLTLADA